MLGFFRKVKPDVAAQKAREALQAGHADEAAALCEAALKAQPEHPDCRTLLARAYEQLGRVGDAIEAYEAACEAAPSYPNFLAAATLYARAGDWEHAEGKYQAAVGKFPTSIPAWKGLADARKRLGKLDLLVQCHDMIVSLQPDSLAAQLDLAEACAEAGDVPRAAALAKAVLEADANSLRALHTLANCLAAERQWDEAIRTYRRLLNVLLVAPDADAAERARLHFDLAAALRRVGNPDEALTHLQACQELQPSLLSAYRAMVDIHREQGDPASAIAVTQQALEVQPSDPAIWHDLGTLHLAAGDARAALEAFTRALKLKPGHTEAICGMAEAFSAAGQHEKAKALCEKLVVKRAFQALPHLTYARVLRAAGDLPAALREADTALGIAPTDPDATKLKRALLAELDEE